MKDQAKHKLNQRPQQILYTKAKKKKKKKDQLKRNSTVKYYINCILQSYATSDKIFNKFRRHI